MRIRTASAADAEQIITHIDNVYDWEAYKDKKQWDFWKKKVEREAGYYRMMEDGKKLIGICTCAWRKLNFGPKQLRMCDVSEICITKELQRKGFGKILLEDALNLMKKNDITLSRLYYREKPLINFYGSYYELFPGRIVELENLHPGAPRPEGISLYNPETDAEPCRELYNDFNRGYLGSFHWEKYHGDWRNPSRIVYREKGKIEGTLYADEDFGYIAYNRQNEGALHNLFAALPSFASEDGKLKIRLPEDAPIKEALREQNIGALFKEISPEESQNMISILNKAELHHVIGIGGDPEDCTVTDLYNYLNSAPCTGGSEIWGADNLNLTKLPLID